MKLKKVIDRTFFAYVGLGFANFLVCTSLMFVLYNEFGVGRHVAPLINYGLGSVNWYLISRFLLFRNSRTTFAQILRFVSEVALCYVLAYYVISPLVCLLLERWPWLMRLLAGLGGSGKAGGNCQMAVGAASYALLNYFGQRYYAFSDRFGRHQNAHQSAETPDGTAKAIENAAKAPETTDRIAPKSPSDEVTD